MVALQATLLLLILWPVFLLVPARYTRAFFVVGGVALLSIVGGPAQAAGVMLACLLGYRLTEGIAGLRRGRHAAFVAGLIVLHALYWACFHLPRPPAFVGADLRPADRAGIFILFSGIGLTFFRLLSYYHDRVRGRMPPVSLGDYLAYMLYFPQLCHGPLERCGPFVEKLRAARRRWQPRDAAIGLLRIGWGVGVFAAVAAVVSRFERNSPLHAAWDVFATPERLNFGQLMLFMHLPGIVLYVGASCTAHLLLGVSRVYGVVGSENYNYVMLATSPRNFWQRWNMTLYAWLLDYAFLPLGTVLRRTGPAICLTFVYCGLLHGLQLRCLVWGLWTGGTLALGIGLWRVLGLRRRHRRSPANPVWALMRVTLAKLATLHWLSIGTMILLDPDYCGWRVFRRYAELVAAAVGLGGA